jgi:hypothetical protein
MRALPTKLKPASGFSHFVHLGLTVLLPALVFILVRINFIQLAMAVILLSKWRMLAVRPRYWPANVRANAVDLMVGVSIVIFMAHTDAFSWHLAWALAYGIWLVFIKPGSSSLVVSAQAFIGQTLALMALFLAWKNAPLVGLVVGLWGICYLAARHYFTSFDEPHSSLYAHFWGYFAAALIWILGHWLLFYGVLAQPTLILSVISFACGGLYYLEETDRLSLLWRRQFVLLMVAVIVVVLIFSDWGDKAF